MALGEVPADDLGVEAGPRQSGMTVRPQKIERLRRNTGAGKLVRVVRVIGDRVARDDPGKPCGHRLAEREEVPARVVERAEQVLDRAARAQLQVQPGEAVAGTRRL